MSAYINWKDGSFRFDAVVQENHVLDCEVTTHPVEQGIDIADNVRPSPTIVTITGVISQSPVYNPTFLFQPTNPLDLFDPNNGPRAIARPPSSTTLTPPQPPLLLSLNSAFNALSAWVGGGSFSVQTAPAAMTQESQSLSFNTFQSSTQVDYIAQAYDILRTLQASAELLTVFGGGGINPAPGAFGGPSKDASPNDASVSTVMFPNMILKTITFDRQQGSGGSAHFTLTLHEIRIVSSSIAAAPTPTIIAANAKPTIPTGSQAPAPSPVPKDGVLFTALGFSSAAPLSSPSGMASVQ